MKILVLVNRVIDGDTIVVQYFDLPLTVRIANIDAPEEDTEFGKLVKKRLSDLILSQEVEIKFIRKDNYNRYVCEVFYQEEALDEKLVGEGLVWHWEKYSEKPDLVLIERTAQEKKIGIWSEEFKSLHYHFRHPQSKKYIEDEPF
jgi:endonuclease YncB( thermonuclease family)